MLVGQVSSSPLEENYNFTSACWEQSFLLHALHAWIACLFHWDLSVFFDFPVLIQLENWGAKSGATERTKWNLKMWLATTCPHFFGLCCRFKPHLRLMDLLQDHKDRENTSVAAVQQALRRQAFQLSKKSCSGECTQILWHCIEGLEGSSTSVAWFSETVVSSISCWCVFFARFSTRTAIRVYTQMWYIVFGKTMARLPPISNRKGMVCLCFFKGFTDMISPESYPREGGSPKLMGAKGFYRRTKATKS